MVQQIKMPSAGQTTDEAKIVTVNVKKGDKVKRGDVLVEAETDKAVLPVESFASGTVLDVLVDVGDSVEAGTVLVVVGKEGDAYTPAGAPKDEPKPEPKPAPKAEPKPETPEYLPIVKGWEPPAPPPAPVKTAYPAMPNAKMLAKEKGVPLDALTPANGVFLKRQDVLAYAPPAPAAEAAYEVMPMSRMRQTIARRMSESLRDIPAFQATVQVEMTACMALRDTYRDAKGVKLSYNDILVKAIAVAARKYPLVNARYEGDEVRVYRHTHVGLAVGLENGLVVPVVRDIDSKGLEQISREYRELVKKARDGKLAPTDMGCGSVTVSNLGMYDVDSFTAIINPPESCILAVGGIRTEPKWNGQTFVAAPRMSITGSFDHRFIDGAYAAQFLKELKALLEAPTLMLG